MYIIFGKKKKAQARFPSLVKGCLHCNSRRFDTISKHICAHLITLLILNIILLATSLLPCQHLSEKLCCIRTEAVTLAPKYALGDKVVGDDDTNAEPRVGTLRSLASIGITSTLVDEYLC